MPPWNFELFFSVYSALSNVTKQFEFAYISALLGANLKRSNCLSARPNWPPYVILLLSEMRKLWEGQGGAVGTGDLTKTHQIKL